MITAEQIPYSAEMERAVIGCIMEKPSLFPIAAAKIDRNSFHSPTNRMIWGGIEYLAKKGVPVDVLALADLLEQWGQIDKIGGNSYLIDIAMGTPSTALFASRLASVAEYSARRQIIAAAAEAAKEAIEEGNAGESVARLRMKLDAIDAATGDHDTAVMIGELIPEVLTRIAEQIEGTAKKWLETGIPALDAILGGLHPGTMTVVGARPSIGKTALAMDIAAAAAEKGVTVAVFSMEMPAASITDRLVFAHASVIRSRDGQYSRSEMTAISRASEAIRRMPMLIDDTPKMTSAEFRAKVQTLARTHSIGLIVIDYLQLMTHAGLSKNSNREQEVAAVSREIKAVAKSFGVPVLVLAQLSRDAEKGERPKLSHLRESGGVEADADAVILLHRDRAEQFNAAETATELPTELIVAKNRNGGTGIAHCNFIPQLVTFRGQAKQTGGSF